MGCFGLWAVGNLVLACLETSSSFHLEVVDADLVVGMAVQVGNSLGNLADIAGTPEMLFAIVIGCSEVFCAAEKGPDVS